MLLVASCIFYMAFVPAYIFSSTSKHFKRGLPTQAPFFFARLPAH
jgi:hypothetical protein